VQNRNADRIDGVDANHPNVGDEPGTVEARDKALFLESTIGVEGWFDRTPT